MVIGATLFIMPLLSIFAIATAQRRWGCGMAHAGLALCCLIISIVAADHLWLAESDSQWTLPLGLPWMHAHFRLDMLSALFLLIVNVPSMLANWFGMAYAADMPERKRITPALPLFLLGMNVAVLADDAFVFLTAWEVMAIGSWLLVIADHRHEANRQAARLYLIMAVFSTLCLLPCFGLMAGSHGDYSFDAMRAAQLGPLTGSLVVALAILGAGSKAGLVPLHAWLPVAHPAAPSHVSALMSGVMTKVALYGLIRILFDLHGHVPWQWGAILMVLGGVTAVLGILYAVFQTEMKVLLAYSTVENVGVAVIGIGLALAFKAGDLSNLGALALVASLYHMTNHAVFKSLLFLGSGAVRHAAGTSVLDQLGGLLNRLPWTGTVFLVGAAAISSLPPLNGFVSEWLILQSLFKGPEMPHWAMKFGVPVVAALLALAVAVAASCFVRLYGVAFLGRPRSDAARASHDVAWGMRLPMACLAILCILLGCMPVAVTNALSLVVGPLVGGGFAVSADLGWPWLAPVSRLHGSYSGTVLVILGGGFFLFAITIARLLGSNRYRRTAAWDCGYPETASNTQYGAESFSQPLRRAFGASLFQAREHVQFPEPGDQAPARFRVEMQDPIWNGLYVRLGRWVDALSHWVNHLQFLTVRRYLLLMFCTLVALLLIVALRQQQW